MLVTFFNAALILLVTWLAWLYFDLKEQRAPARERYTQLVGGVSAIIDRLEGYDKEHAGEIAELAHLIGVANGMQEEQLQSMHAAAMLHDIGELLLPRELLKSTEKLAPEDLELLHTHTLLGELHLKSRFAEPDEVPALIRWHHERWDGLGYPDNLKGEEIPLASRIIALADSISAMAAHRQYRQVQYSSADAIIREIKSLSGLQFDPKLIKSWQDLGCPLEVKKK